MEVTIRRSGENSAEFDLPQGCPFCGGTVAVRVTPHGAASCCKECRWLSKPKVGFAPQGIQVAYPAAGYA